MKKSYFRAEIDALAGYVPGEQPKMADLVKLNTNENPYPPSPAVQKVLQDFDWERLRRYPNPAADPLRDLVAERFGYARENVICGNGSDDLLTMIFRSFTAPDKPLAMPYPSYSLYPVLAAMQGAEVIKVPLIGENFALPENFLEQVKAANLLAIARPNAPTGNSFPLARIREICAKFDGIVLIDEAYADFADDNCIALVKEFDNVIVMRTFSKSFALAGLRLGYALANPTIIDGLMKLKDSYNVNALSQAVGAAAFQDETYFNARREQVKTSRGELKKALEKLHFKVVESQTNFLFATPPDGDGERCFKLLRAQAVIVRYFKDAVTAPYVRITIGTEAEIDRLLAVLSEAYPA